MFMTTDRLFVIMLVFLIPMTGCFGAVDNADAEQNDSDTIVNNYYNNTSTTVIEKFSAGGIIDFNSTTDYTVNGDHRYYTPYNFTTVAGEFVSVHYFKVDNLLNPYLRTVCDDGSTGYIQTTNIAAGSALWGSYTTCVHTIDVASMDLDKFDYQESYESGERLMSWNLVYSIESLTVV